MKTKQVISVRMVEEYLYVRVTDRAKLLRRGDLLVFDPTLFVLEGWRTGRGVVINAVCPWVKEESHFKDLVRLMGLVANPQLPNTIREEILPKKLWAYRFL